MLISQFDKFVNKSTQEILGSEIEQENLEPMLSTDIDRSAGGVTGVKGENEVYYRTGNVNLTSADIGALDEDNVYNGLDQTSSGYALDARQGKTLADDVAGLADDVAGKLDKANVYNGLDQTASGYALDARQGKVLADKLNDIQSGIAIIVDGDTASIAVPVGGYAYIKNNLHGLTEGMYTNTSSVAFPAGGGTADGTVFTAVSGGGLNDLQRQSKWKEASDYADAYNNAISEIALIGKGVTTLNLDVCLTVIIPKNIIDNTPTYYSVSDSYNTNAIVHLQAVLTPTTISDIGMYEGAKRVRNERLTWLYR